MTQEKWQEIKGKIKDGFELLEEKTEELGTHPGTKETVVFKGPLGKMKLEFMTHPVILDTKAIGGKRIGAIKKIEYRYSESENVYTLKIYQWNEGQASWTAMETKGESFRL